MKKLFFILFLAVFGVIDGQEKYLDRQGNILFEASEATFEPVKAKNSSVTAIINIQTGAIASLALMKEFRFRNALMQEHFNENYIESDTYPKATFRGEIADFDFKELSRDEKDYTVSGVLNLRGIDKKVDTKLTISIEDGIIYLKGNFITSPQDFNIKIPKIVRNKIAKEVKVELNFKFKKQ
ncbi:MAG: YceI family protein [Flavobacteriaceae bacterium]|nr:YceI family protein [Flavobacteriaceae bacterium]